jgi:molecular chaperone IbpA|tara:strand:+ start:638 stop:1090 length:453 start_codon:yes stop_codon:yes gene_type:complete
MNYKLTTSRPNLSSALQDYRDWVIGYDKIFNTMLNQPSNSITNQPNYPPHNLIEYEDGKYTITLAIAGISKEDLDVTLEEQNLTISYDGKETESNGKVLYRGIASRSFKKVFHLAENIEVNDASIDNGLLTIELEQNIPDHKKPRQIELK